MMHKHSRSSFFRVLACMAFLFAMPRAPTMAQSPTPSDRPEPKMIINYGGGGWKNFQVQEPCILVNPKDPRKLIMFFSGTKDDGKTCLGKAWAEVSDPLIWHEDPGNPFFRGDPKNAFEAGTRLDSVIYLPARDEYWFYYTGNDREGRNAILLAVCPAGKDGYNEVTAAQVKRHPGNPILTPQGQGRDDGNCVSQAAVIREKGVWYLFYSYRNGTQILPGIRLATSRDGKQWTKKPGPDLLAAAPEQRYIEWHQVYKIGGRYVLLYEGYNGGKRWGADVATSSRLTGGWKKIPASLIDQTQWPGYSEKAMFHVATPAFYHINNKWRLFFQAAPKGQYEYQHWALWCVTCDKTIQNIAAIPIK
jgi:hypothetical protein